MTEGDEQYKKAHRYVVYIHVQFPLHYYNPYTYCTKQLNWNTVEMY